MNDNKMMKFALAFVGVLALPSVGVAQLTQDQINSEFDQCVTHAQSVAKACFGIGLLTCACGAAPMSVGICYGCYVNYAKDVNSCKQQYPTATYTFEEFELMSTLGVSCENQNPAPGAVPMPGDPRLPDDPD
jgi:hypothetical protein